MDEELEPLRAMYPDLSEEKLTIAKDNLDKYLALAWEIFEGTHLAASCPGGDFEGLQLRGNIQGKVDPPQTQPIPKT